MMNSPTELEQRALSYASARNIELKAQLGYGNDGTIWSTNRKSAVKGFHRLAAFQRERNAYQRLQEHGVDRVLGLLIPHLIDYDDQLLVVEMGIVSPPYLLDFGKAHLDGMPDFSPEVMEDWELEKSELFGRDWPQVKKVLRALRRYGIYYLDATPGNIRLREKEVDD